MHNIKYLIKKKINQLGLKKKFDEASICKIVNEFIEAHLLGAEVRAEAYHNGSLIIKANNAVGANEIYFFQEELRFFLKQNNFSIRNIRIVY